VTRELTDAPVDGSADLRHLLRHVHRVERRVRRAVAARRESDPAPDDPYRGLYLTPESVARILATRWIPDDHLAGLAPVIEKR